MYENTLRTLVAQRQQNIIEGRELLDKQIAENRAETAEEAEKRTNLDKAIAGQDERIASVRRLMKEDAAADGAPEADDPETRSGRPALEHDDTPRADRRHASKKYRESFRHYMMTGERRDVVAGTNSAGGFLLAPVQMSDEIIKQVDDAVFVKAKARKFRVTKAQAIGVRKLNARMSDPTWTSEIGQIPAADSQLAFGRRDLHPYLLVKLALVSETMIDIGSEAEAIVNSELAYRYGITLENAFYNGDGVSKPLGVFVPSADGISTNRDVATEVVGTLGANDFVNARYKIKQGYLNPAEASWALNRTVVSAARKIKDGQGRYIWQEGLASDKPDTILGLPYNISEYVPGSVGTGNYVACLGNWSYYGVAEVIDLRIQRLVEKYADTNEVGFKGKYYCDGAPLLEDAFARIKVA